MSSVYAELTDHQNQEVSRIYYRFWLGDKPSGNWIGPYRDKTDAENAAEEEAKLHGWELIWRN